MDEVERGFIEAIERDPEDEEARTVYADWLEQRGDPRGEYVRLEALQSMLPRRLAELEAGLDRAWLVLVGRRYRVVLVKLPSNKIGIIKAVRGVTGLGLSDAMQLVEYASERSPVVIAEDLGRAAADRILQSFGELSDSLRIECYVGPPARELVRVVLLRVYADQEIAAIKAVREITGRGVARCRDLVRLAQHGHPFVLHDKINPGAAEGVAAVFRGIGEIRIETVLRR
jgi:uncharacterized protein (TIGR02996 family)